MARIIDIRFSSVPTNEGCSCDRCGQWIKNVWAVSFSDGVKLKFGIDCFEKMINNSRLDVYRRKLMKKTMKRLTNYSEREERERSYTEDTDPCWRNIQNDPDDYWNGRTWEEYHEWMLKEFYPARIADVKRELAKFKNIDFEI